MKYNCADIGAGKHLCIKRKGVFEGWAELLSAEDEGSTFRDDNTNELLVKQRWLIRWLSIEEVPNELSRTDRITQITLQGKTTHRKIIYRDKDRNEDSYNVDHSSRRKYTEFPMDDNFDGMF